MRVVLAMLIGAMLIARPAIARPLSPPSIEDAIAHAASRGRPLVIEFHASWCKPCRYFEEHVLPAPDVQRALGGVELVRYDLDSAVGALAARRFGVTSVPTFLVLDRSGGVAVRESGLRAGGEPALIAWFAGLLRDAPADQRGAAELEDAVRDQPWDLDVRMQLADRYRAMGRPLDAIPHYRAIAFAPAAYDGARLRAATATAAHDELVGADARLQVAVDAAVELIRRFPESPEAAVALALAIESGRVSPDTIDALLIQHRDATHDRVAAVRLALLAGHPGDAAALVREALADRALDPTARLLAAEVAADAGDTEAAAAVVAEVCLDAPTEVALHCYVLESGFASGRRSPGVMQLRTVADRTLADLEHPGAHSPELAEVDPTFAIAAAQLLRIAGRNCARGPRAQAVMVSLVLADGGGPASLISVYDADDALTACLAIAVAARPLPPAPAALEHRLYEYVYLPAAGEAGPAPAPGRERLGRGAIAYGLMRAGAVVGIGAGTTGVADVGELEGVHAIAAGELEGGIDTANHSFYTVRGFVGGGTRTGRATLSALIGVGASDPGGFGRVSVEVPVELRVTIALGRPHGHVWARSSALRGDEHALGAGVTIARSVFVGAVVTDAPAGRSAALLFGVPVGGWF